MKTFTQTTEQVRRRIIETDAQAQREQSAINYLKRLSEFGVTSITQLNESELSEFIQSLRVLEG